MAVGTGESCMYCTKCSGLMERLDKLEEFIWNNHIEPECEYKHSVDLKFTCDHDLNEGPKYECSAGLTPRCDQDVCPIFRINH